MKIGIVIGSIRQGRKGLAIGQWVLERARARQDADVDYELIDLMAFDVPLLTCAVVPGAANKRYESAQVTAWSEAIDACDGFVFVTPEYNHSVPGGLKNAFDSLGSEWAHKVVAFVSYGADGGVRAVEHWRSIVSNFHMIDVRQQLPISLFFEYREDGFVPADRRPAELNILLDQLLAATTRFAPERV
ncbi:MAG: NADPH-dependent FMN reductase [Nostocoides sp.]